MPIELTVPNAGESITEVQIGEWLKAEGEFAAADEPVVAIETDKASMDIPAPVSGVVTRILKHAGDIVPVGTVIAHMEQGDAPASSSASSDGARGSVSAAASRRAAPMAPAATAAPASPTPASPPQAPDSAATEPRVMPAARRAMAEAGLTPADVEPTGPGGRILKEDVARHVARPGAPTAAPAAAPPAPAEPTAAPTPAAPAAKAHAPVGGYREDEVVPMSMIRRRIAARLVEASRTAALLTTFNECDMSAVMALRTEHQEAFQKRYGVKLGFMSFFVKAAVDALRLVPEINAEIRGNDIIYHNYQDVGVAVSSDKGLVVPVLRNAERMSFAEIERAILGFAERARANKLTLDELEGGTFTISNGGIFGSMLSTPIVNPPQSGILGLHAIQERPVVRDGQVVARPMMYLALTYDHRIVDGRGAVTFLRRIKDVIENPSRMLLEI